MSLYEDSCGQPTRTLILLTESVRATEEEAAAYMAITAQLPQNACVTIRPYYTFYPSAPYTGPLVGMYVSMDGLLTANLVTVPFDEFDIKLVPWENLL